MYNQSSSSSSSNSRGGGPSNYNQNRNMTSWYNEPNDQQQQASSSSSSSSTNWQPTWNHPSMNQQQPQHQENPPWIPGQLEIPNLNPNSRNETSRQSSFYPPPQQQQQIQREPYSNQLQPQMHTPGSKQPSTTTSPRQNSNNTPNTGKRSTFDTPEKSDTNISSSPIISTKRQKLNKDKDRNTSGGGGQVKKRKTKRSNSNLNKQIEIDDEQQSLPSPSENDKDKEKRTKTGRACDACRTKKIRCDILRTENSPSGLDSQPICAHCKQSNLECTFFLPITETRFKKKRQAAKDLKESTAESQQPSVPIGSLALDKAGGSPETYNLENLGGGSQKTDDRGGGRVEGPTSIAFLLHTAIPTIQSEAFDLRHHSSWEVLEDGNGVIRVNAPPTKPTHADADPNDPTRAHNRLNKPVLSAQTMSLLVNAYFKDIAPLFPIISRAEFASKSSPSPLMLYSICGLGATRRQFPREIFAGVRGVINGILRNNDILSDASFDNVQALLLLAQVGDLHAQPTAATASASLIRTGAAIRMAQDLGLHRESSLRAQGAHDLAYVELRRRVWATCVIMDRWYGAALGIPLLVDLLDCDVLLPAPYEISTHTEPSDWPIEFNFMALGEHLKLSILMGRVLKMIYSPTGLKPTTDAQLAGLVSDMEKWKESLPDPLQFRGSDSPHVAGLLHLGYAALQFLFWRVFMRITYSCPPHLTFCVQVSHWTKMIQWSRESLEWLDANDDALDTLFIFPYAATSCALIQYHTWARRGDSDALDTLRLVKETARRWEQAVQPDQMSIRRKTCETMTLLYEAALKTDPESHENQQAPKLPANPTAGVIPRQGGFSRIKFKKDENRSGGGVFIAQNENDKNSSGLNENDVLLVSEMSKTQEKELQKKGNTELEDVQIRNAALKADQKNREQHDRDLTEHHNELSKNEKEASTANLQINPGGAYNLNPLIHSDANYSNVGMGYGQSESNPYAGAGMMDITRTGEQYPMPAYPLDQDMQQYNNEQQRHHDQSQSNQHIYGSVPPGIEESPYNSIPEAYSGPTTVSSINDSNHTQTNHNNNNTQGELTNGYNSGYSTMGPSVGSMNMNNINGIDQRNGQIQQQQQHHQQQHLHGNATGGNTNFDPSFLDSLPVSTFDWESWSDYFDKFLPSANQSFETMQ